MARDPRESMFQRMMAQGASAAPVQHWTQGLARLAQAGVGAHMAKKLRGEQEAKDFNAAQERTQAMQLALGRPAQSETLQSGETIDWNPQQPNMMGAISALQSPQNQALQGSLIGQAMKQTQPNIKNMANHAIFKAQQGQQLTPQDQAAIRAMGVIEGQKTSYTKGPYGELVPSTGPNPYAQFSGGMRQPQMGAQQTPPQMPTGASQLRTQPPIMTVDTQPLSTTQTVADQVQAQGIPTMTGDQIGAPVGIQVDTPSTSPDVVPTVGQALHVDPRVAQTPFGQKETFKQQVKQGVALDAKRMEAMPKVSDSIRNFSTKMATVVDQANKALSLIEEMEKGFLGSGWESTLYSGLPDTRAGALSGYLDTIKANIGFDELQKMRDASPTGGALGQVSEMENRLLQAINGALDPKQTGQLKENLVIIRDLYPKLMQEKQAAFQRDFGQAPQGISAPSRGRVKVVTPEGNLGTIDATELNEALQAGWKRYE